MENLKDLQCQFIEIVEDVINTKSVQDINAHEMGEVIDIIKDLSETMYYTSIVNAMEESNNTEYYLQKYLPESVRERMHYKTEDTKTITDIMSEIDALMESETKENKVKMKSELTSYLTNLVL